MRFRLSFFAATLLIPAAALAIQFPDVPAEYPHANAISNLSDRGVIGGNPDGTFRPHDPVNRAAMLKMLYLASGKTAERTGGCFSDVQPGSWYESIVCDAALHGYVKGYEGGVFKPAQAVTRAEALKLAIAVFGLSEANLDVSVNMYTDVPMGEWYARYVHTALVDEILPIPGQDGPTFLPAKVLERGEAAAYVWNTLRATTNPSVKSSSSSSTSSVSKDQASSAMTEIEKRAAASRRVEQQEQNALDHAKANTIPVSIPFSDKHVFDGKSTLSYTFNVSTITTVDIVATINEWDMGGLTCRLYHLGRSGFSQEYYLGFKDGKNCMFRVAMAPGSWRLELDPEKLAPTLSISAKVITGDGNDGFAQAATLPYGNVITGDLGAGDLEDWFTFSVPKDTKTTADGGRQMAFTVSSTDTLGCIIYPLDDVDLFSFAGPECRTLYLFPTGTYMAVIRHVAPFGARQSYTIQVK